MNINDPYSPLTQNPVNPYNNYSQYTPYKESPMSVGDWLITYLITAIPVVNIVMLFVWAFGSNESITKQNWAKANLIFMLIGIVIVIFMVIGLGLFVSDSFEYTT